VGPWRRQALRNRSSLRTELLFNLAFLAAGALLLVLSVSRIIQLSTLSPAAVVVLLGASVLAFVFVGNYLIEWWVLRPLAAVARSAESIAAGEVELRVPEEGPKEIASLARALNQLTDQLLQNQDRLAENVRSLDETNQRLTEAYIELVQAERMASLGHLAAGVAHEIGNPLGAVLGYISLQKRRGGDPELIDGLEREARRIDRIVRGLLDYARPGSAVPEAIDINGSVVEVVKLLREQGWLVNTRVDLDLGDDLPMIMADSHRVDQIFVNLLRNAETAMGGEGTITVVTRAERYEPAQQLAIRRADDPPGVNYSHLRRARNRSARSAHALEPNSEVVRISVVDTGPGIPDEILSSIFDPFFTTKGPGEGTGLGLAIVAGTVAEMGGRIEASSHPGGGAEFNLWLPTASRTT
jgi:two-component system NtrC family sensor kinase